MKKLISVILAGAMALSLTACGSSAPATTDTTAAAAAGSMTVGSFAASMALSMGIGMIAQGLLTLLFPQPTPDSANTNSKYLGVAQNTTKSGTRIPFGYGLFKISGQILSYNISSSNIKVYGG